MITKSQLRQIIVEEMGRVSPETAAAADLLINPLQSTQNKLDKVDDIQEIESFLTSFIELFIEQTKQEPSAVKQILTNLGNAILKMDTKIDKEGN
jgi:hypothetical protein